MPAQTNNGTTFASKPMYHCRREHVALSKAYVAGYTVHVALKQVKHSCKDTLAISRSIMVSGTDPLCSLVKDIDGRWRVYPTITPMAYN